MSNSDGNRIQLRCAGQRVRVFAGEIPIADTRAAVCLAETGYPPRWYIPPTDVAMHRLAASDTRTHCPYKGDAHYFDLQHDDRILTDAAWCYTTPIDAVAAIAGHLAFDHPQLRLHIEHGAGIR